MRPVHVLLALFLAATVSIAQDDAPRQRVVAVAGAVAGAGAGAGTEEETAAEAEAGAPATDEKQSEKQSIVIQDDIIVVGRRPFLGSMGERVLMHEEWQRSAAGSLDDALRRVPGFTLFRRSGSRLANPTTQGLTLRGVGASGAGRALVLLDDVPLHDPFGGWVPWFRVPRLALGRAEVLRGGGSDLYGSGAVGGTLRLSRRARPEGVEALAAWDTLGSPLLSALGNARLGTFDLDVAAESWRTRGAHVVDDSVRGPIDERAWSRHRTGDVTLRRAGAGGRHEWHARVQAFHEERGNGTPLQGNATDGLQAMAGGFALGAGGGTWEWSIDGLEQEYDQTFSSVDASRRGETATRAQRVPSRMHGARLEWSRPVGGLVLAAGSEIRRREGRSFEVDETTRELSSAGAAQLSTAAWLDATASFGEGERAFVRGTLRFEQWEQDRARRSLRSVVTPLRDRSASAWVPRVGVGRKLSGRAWLTGTAWGAFRAPTLNELYRDFQAGDVLTRANDALQPERARGADVSWSWKGAALQARVTAFVVELDDAIGNVTESSSSILIERRRVNVGSLRSRGLETDVALQLPRSFELRLAHALTDSRITESDVGLQGKRTPQVPRHAASLRLARDEGRHWWAFDARWTSSQTEDDLGTLRLAPGWVLDGAVGFRLRDGLWLEGAIENVLDDRIETGRTPLLTVGPPRTARVGLRWAWNPKE